MTKQKPRKPDYILKMRDNATKQGNRIGAAWVNVDGSIAITLDVGVVVAWTTAKSCSLILFTNERP